MGFNGAVAGASGGWSYATQARGKGQALCTPSPLRWPKRSAPFPTAGKKMVFKPSGSRLFSGEEWNQGRRGFPDSGDWPGLSLIFLKERL